MSQSTKQANQKAEKSQKLAQRCAARNVFGRLCSARAQNESECRFVAKAGCTMCVCVCVCGCRVRRGTAADKPAAVGTIFEAKERAKRRRGARRSSIILCVCVSCEKKRARKGSVGRSNEKAHSGVATGCVRCRRCQKTLFLPDTNTNHKQHNTHKFEPNIRQLHCRRRTTPQNRHTPQPTTQTTSVSRL